MSLSDGGEAGSYATRKAACRISPALNSSSILGISSKHECQGLCRRHGSLSLPLLGVVSTVGSVEPSPCPRGWVAEEGTLMCCFKHSSIETGMSAVMVTAATSPRASPERYSVHLSFGLGV